MFNLNKNMYLYRIMNITLISRDKNISIILSVELKYNGDRLFAIFYWHHAKWISATT